MEPVSTKSGGHGGHIERLQAGGGEVRLFSALKKQGLEEVAQLLWDWTHPANATGEAASPAAPETPAD